MADLILMRSLTIFHNPRIRNGRNGLVQAREEFHTDRAHALELRGGGIAYPVNPEDLDGPGPVFPRLPSASAPSAPGTPAAAPVPSAAPAAPTTPATPEQPGPRRWARKAG